MKLRKWSALLLLLCILWSTVVPVMATETAAPEEEVIQEEPVPVPDAVEDKQEGFVVQQYADTAEIFKTIPASVMLIDLNSGVTLYELDTYERNFPASLTKIMTCWLALEHGNLDDVLTVSETALQNLHESGSTSGLQQGEQMRMEGFTEVEDADLPWAGKEDGSEDNE